MARDRDIKSRLSQTLDQFSPKSQATDANVSCKSSRHISAKTEKLQKALGGEVLEHPAGETLLIRQSHKPSYKHGRLSVAEFIGRSDYCVSHVRAQSDIESLDAKKFVFFDTETTGLGGAGSLAFLAGVASVVDGQLETRQYLLPDLSDEEALLEHLSAEFDSDTVLVTYNGIAFDVPLTLDRFIIHRIRKDIPFKHHLDLLYPARSLFKRRIQDCSLGNVEAQVFGFQREDDIPGYLVPSVYFDWLHNDATKDLSAVIEHNRLDIVSLAMLMAVITESHVSGGASLSEPLDAFSLARGLGRRKNHDGAAKIVMSRGEDLARVGSPDVDFQRSLILKRVGDFEAACAIWEKLERRQDSAAQMARIELAKWYEHRSPDFAKALALTERALRFSLNHDRLTEELNRRRQRLLRKIQSE